MLRVTYAFPGCPNGRTTGWAEAGLNPKLR